MLADQRALLSQNVLSQLRNLVEGVVVRLHAGSLDAEFNYAAIEPGLAFVKSRAKLNFLSRFHKLIQKSASHYTLDGDASERLMLKYYEYLYRIRSLIQDQCDIAVLANLEAFPVDLDPSLREYHEKIAARIQASESVPRNSMPRTGTTSIRLALSSSMAEFTTRSLYTAPSTRQTNLDRIIAFTDIDMTTNYAAMMRLQGDSIEVLGQTMPITIIREWEVSIRPCEFNNFARILGITLKAQAKLTEYRYLMENLTTELG